jgi:Uri superfamily endonuclease
MLGIIYAIIDDGYFYIDSTKRTILERIGEHISDSKSKSKNSKLYSYINKIRKGWEDILVITLEIIECETEEELHKKEEEYILEHIKDPYCLNVVQNTKQRYFISQFYKKRK